MLDMNRDVILGTLAPFGIFGVIIFIINLTHYIPFLYSFKYYFGPNYSFVPETILFIVLSLIFRSKLKINEEFNKSYLITFIILSAIHFIRIIDVMMNPF